MALPSGPSQRGSVHFLHEIPADNRRIRVLAVVDDFARECLAPEVTTPITCHRASWGLDRMKLLDKLPKALAHDEVTKFTPQAYYAGRGSGL